MKLLVYTIRHNGEIIAWSFNKTEILKYIENYYIFQEEIEFTINEYSSEKIINYLQLRKSHLELQLLVFDIFLPKEEVEFWLNSYYQNYSSIKEALKRYINDSSQVNLSEMGFLRILRMKSPTNYNNLKSLKNYMESLGKDDILMNVCNSKLTKELIQLDKDFRNKL